MSGAITPTRTRSEKVPQFNVTLSRSVRAYAEIEIEAETLEAACLKIFATDWADFGVPFKANYEDPIEDEIAEIYEESDPEGGLSIHLYDEDEPYYRAPPGEFQRRLAAYIAKAKERGHA
jgi:hypothetical protein